MKSSLGELPSENLQLGFPGGSDSKESACKAGDPGSIPGSGRSPGVENSTLLYYSCLENSMDRGAWQSTVHGVSHKELNVTDQLFLSLKNSLVKKGQFLHIYLNAVLFPTSILPRRNNWQPTPVFLPGESHGQRSLAGYSPWGCKSQTRFSD